MISAAAGRPRFIARPHETSRSAMLRPMTSGPPKIAALLLPKRHHERSVFTASNLLREARRQRGLREVAVPAVCILDPDGDLTDYLHANGLAAAAESWACYHTRLSRFALAEQVVG